MQLEFTTEQEELRDSARAVLDRECPPNVARRVVEKGSPPDALWDRMVELGWPAITLPEAVGGLGLGTVELAVVVEELGRALAPGPFIATVTQFAPSVREVGDAEQQARFLAAVAEGRLTGTLAIAETSAGFDPAAVAALAEPAEDGAYRLRGQKRHVLDPGADEVVVVARLADTNGDDGVGAFVVPGDALTVTPTRSLDASRPLGTIDLDSGDGTVAVSADRVLGEPGPATAAGLRRAVEETTMALAVETVGVCQWIFDTALAYAKDREQFGAPIGSFQAIKHKFTDMLVALERARATGYFAALTIAEGDEQRGAATSVAKAAAGDCEHRLTKEGIQILGGIGYTWEHDMHLYVRRAKTDASLFGTAADHRARLATALLGPPPR
jgi:alkylation response protein AidB-like acyl-CoA dehydrogenase